MEMKQQGHDILTEVTVELQIDICLLLYLCYNI